MLFIGDELKCFFVLRALVRIKDDLFNCWFNFTSLAIICDHRSVANIVNVDF